MSKVTCGGLSGRYRAPNGRSVDAPLVVAIHGGTYTSSYFDLPGYSLLDRASAIGVPIFALDRPGYGESPPLPPEQADIRTAARVITTALKDIWQRYGEGTRGIFIIGHSIGGAVTCAIASEGIAPPLLGIAVSGMGLRTPPDHVEQRSQGVPEPFVDFPAAIKDQLMFGPPGSYTPDMPQASHIANVLAPGAELVDIVCHWPSYAHDLLAKISVPTHYRQGAFDHMWIVDQGEVDGFARALSGSPRVDAALVPKTGHCMDFHRIGKALHVQQLGFALQCAAEV